MGKRDKAKLKSNRQVAAEENARVAAEEAIAHETANDGGVAAADGWGHQPGTDAVEGFGHSGWGESPIDEHHPTTWIPRASNGTPEPVGPDISAWIDKNSGEMSGMMGFGAKKHPSAAMRMSMVSHSNHPDPHVAALLERMRDNPAFSPPRAPTELSVHRSSAAFSGNPLRSGIPTRANSISGPHTAPPAGTFPPLPSSNNLQQTRFFQNRPAQPLPTIHSDRSLRTFGMDPADNAPGTRQTWIPQIEEELMAESYPMGAGYGAMPMSYMAGDNHSAEMLGMTGQDTISFQESGGEALVAANRALFKSARPASERIHWGLNSAQDPSVQGLLDWVDQMAPELAMLAMHKFLNTQKRGALISNATYRPASTPDEPAFDWITFEQSRGTLDATFQEGIAKYDPLTTAIVYVFLLSPSGNSMGIWKRKLIIPPETQEMYRDQLAEVYAYVKRQPHVIAVESLPRGAKTPKPPGVRMSTKPYGATEQSFTAAGESLRERKNSGPTPAKATRNSATLKKDSPEKKKEKRSTWSRIFGGKSK